MTFAFCTTFTTHHIGVSFENGVSGGYSYTSGKNDCGKDTCPTSATYCNK